MDDSAVIEAFQLIVDKAHSSQNDFLIKLIREHEQGTHHQFVEEMIKNREANKAIMDKVKGNIIFWSFMAIVGFFSSLGWWIWEHIKW